MIEEKLRKHIEEIIPLTDDEFSFVLSHFSIQKFKKHQPIFREGESVQYVYFVLSGLLKLTYNDDSGKPHIVSFAMEGWWESDFYAYFNQSKSTMTLECLEDTLVGSISLEDYRLLCAGMQKMETFLLKKSNAGFIASQQRILSLLSSNAKQRYEQLLKQYPSLFQRVSKTQVASYLGVSRETLSRLSS